MVDRFMFSYRFRASASGYIFILFLFFTFSSFFSRPAGGFENERTFAAGRLKLDAVSRDRRETFDTCEARVFDMEIYYPALRPASQKSAPYDSFFRPRSKEALSLFLKKNQLIKYEKFFNDLYTGTFIDAAPDVSGAPYPVIFFFPGSGTPAGIYLQLIKRLVGSGFIVAAIGDPYESSVSVLSGGRIIQKAGEYEKAMTDEVRVAGIERLLTLRRIDDFGEAFARIRELSEKGPLAGIFDLSRAGALGHSFGGKTAMILNKMRPEIRAAVNLDGYFYNAGTKTAVNGAWYFQHNPVLLLSSEEFSRDGHPIREANRRSLELFAKICGPLLDIKKVKNSKHMSFSDLGAVLPGNDGLAFTASKSPETFYGGIAETIAAFFDRNLK